ncbi:hypothetical protein [Thermococcus sp.]|uniref:hypothetical protein n=1 Tax=Thermococcus sp. TaxID=35749 RepID=UPI0025D83ABB|nr:hypothetical protein [Thermococcus sp.]
MIIAKPCTTMKGLVIGAYSWEKPIKIDLTKTADCLKEKGYSIKRLIPGMLLIAGIEGWETSIYPSGKIIIKLLDEVKRGQDIARIVYYCAGVLEVVI